MGAWIVQILSLYSAINALPSSPSSPCNVTLDGEMEDGIIGVIECCVCLDSTSSFLNESQFIKAFGFYCLHSSNNVCIDCWNRLLYRHGNRTKCPLCRACKLSENGPNLPYGLEELEERAPRVQFMQPGYAANENETIWQTICRRMDITNGCIAFYVRESLDLFMILNFHWCFCDNHVISDVNACIVFPVLAAASITFTIGLCATTSTNLIASCCCFCDCCHLCFPEWELRRYCLDECSCKI